MSEEIEKNEGKTEIQSQETLSQEEILERSRRENEKYGDERQQKKWQWVVVCGYAGALFTVFVLEILFIVLGYDALYVQALNLIALTACSAMVCCMAVVAKRLKKVFIALACIDVVAILLVWVFFALQLAGIQI